MDRSLSLRTSAWFTLRAMEEVNVASTQRRCSPNVEIRFLRYTKYNLKSAWPICGAGYGLKSGVCSLHLLSVRPQTQQRLHSLRNTKCLVNHASQYRQRMNSEPAVVQSVFT